MTGFTPFDQEEADVSGNVSFSGNQVAKAPKFDPALLNNTQQEFAGDPAKKTASNKSTTSDPGRLPLPDYKNPESRLKYAENWRKKYGPSMQGRGDTPLRVNEIPDTAKDRLTAKQLSIKATKDLGLDPALFYASSMEEGMSGLYKNKEGKIYASKNKDFPVSGFLSFGLDTFSDAYPGLVKKGYLPEGFDKKFSKSVEKNEKKEKVNSADFQTAEDALTAKAAMIKSSEDEVGEFAERNKIDLSSEAKKFFTLINYNAGAGNAQKMLKSYSQKGYLKDDNFLKKRPDKSWKQPYDNVIVRMRMAKALKDEGLFD